MTKNTNLIQYQSSAKLIFVNYFFLILILTIGFISLYINLNVLENWSNPQYIGNKSFAHGRLGEIIIFALCFIAFIYSLLIIIFYLGHSIYCKFKNINYSAFNKINTLFILGLLFHWILFLIIFYRP